VGISEFAWATHSALLFGRSFGFGWACE